MKTKCEIDGCERNVLAKGLCRMHYLRTIRGNTNMHPRSLRRHIETCSIEGCSNKFHCKNHGKVGSEIAQELNVSVTTVTNLHKKGILQNLLRNPILFRKFELPPNEILFRKF